MFLVREPSSLQGTELLPPAVGPTEDSGFNLKLETQNHQQTLGCDGVRMNEGAHWDPNSEKMGRDVA